jgi:hypothetical protein
MQSAYAVTPLGQKLRDRVQTALETRVSWVIRSSPDNSYQKRCVAVPTHGVGVSERPYTNKQMCEYELMRASVGNTNFLKDNGAGCQELGCYHKY